ncbi:hypothetical protein PoB_003890500 [Plakobranchus ocellatus]|uniref:Uncharacterized protein n=1 Tax=Plakobranchus ocellatus TaxID=259542 RepID=A0AAV4AVL9_9GAST|nr:hypothetical protein PoB_003890500 [Plakobranchus ocellatus]
MVPPPNELCGIPRLGLVPDQEIQRYIKDLGPAVLKSSPTEVINIEHFWNSALSVAQGVTFMSQLTLPMLSVGPHWRQQFTCPTIHVLKYSLSLVRAHTKSATCRSVGAILCVLQPGLTSLALSDKGKGAAIT